MPVRPNKKKLLKMMEKLPQDPIILYSYINTKLRDNYRSLDELCDDLQVDRKSLEEKLRAFGFEYNPETNRFF